MLKRIAIFASGEGSNFEALVRAAQSKELAAEVVGLITNRENIPALKRAERLQIPSAVFKRKDFANLADCDRAIAAQLKAWRCDWIVLAGYLALIGPEVLSSFPKRIVNSHPSLLPKYGGEGLYGNKVHEAVLAAGETETGITIHLIDEEYDRGEVVAQTTVEVIPGDTPETLSARIKAVENSFYPQILNQLLVGTVTTR